MIHSSPEQLLLEYRNGNKEAFASLYENYIHRWVTTEFKLTGICCHDTEEITQAVAMKLMRRPGLFIPEKGNLRAYLWGWAKRESLTLRIRESLNRERLREMPRVTAAHEHDLLEIRDSVNRVMSRLTLRELEAVYAWAETGNHAEAARKLGVKYTTYYDRVRNALSRAELTKN